MRNAPPLQTTRVLLVEDSVHIRSRLRSLIEESAPDMIVAEAGTVAEALDQFAIAQPDAVVLDLGLPDGDGSGVLLAIKCARPACVVMVLTNSASPESRAHCRRLGADHFFDKASEFDSVGATLQALARLHGSPQRELTQS